MCKNDNLEVLKTYKALLEAHFPTELFLKNEQTLKFQQTDRIKENAAVYYPNKNTIYYGIYNPDSILHELIHVASYDGTNEKFYLRGKGYYKSSGFAMEDNEIKGVGFSISEGLADLFCMLFYNNGLMDGEKKLYDRYYSSLLLSRLITNLTSLGEIGELYFKNDLLGFHNLIENKIGDHESVIVTISDEIYSFGNKSMILNILSKMDKVILTNTIIELSYRNICDRDLDSIFKNYIKDYFEGDNKNMQTSLKKLEKAKKEHGR